MSRKNTYSGIRGGKTKKELGVAYRIKNKEKLNEKSKAYYKKNKEKISAEARAYYLKNKKAAFERQSTRQLVMRYGLTKEDVKRMVIEQGGVCDLCKLPIGSESGRDVVVDHDHETGRVRGILHKLCNLGIGAFGDSIQRIRQAEKYLQKHYLKEISELGQEQEANSKMEDTGCMPDNFSEIKDDVT